MRVCLLSLHPILSDTRHFGHAEFAEFRLTGYSRSVVTTIIMLALFGAIAIALEMVLPGGILGVAGGLFLLTSAVLCFVEFGFLAGFFASLAIGLFAFAMFWLWMRHFHRLPGTKNLILTDHIARGDSLAQAEILSVGGHTGTALTDIAPSGKALLDEQKLDVIAESTAIAKGSPVQFIRRSGAAWIVRASPVN